MIAWLMAFAAFMGASVTAALQIRRQRREIEGLSEQVLAMQNSFEQALIAIGVHLALATILTGRERLLIPVLVALHVVGRIAFRLGYPAGAGARAFGMSMTYYPILLSTCLAGVLVIVRV